METPADVLLDLKKSHYINTIQKTTHHHDVFLDSDIDSADNYRDLISILFNADDTTSINIFINSNGGHLDTALAIVEGLKVTDAHVCAILLGACHSAANIIALHCHEAFVMDSAYMMIHTASGGSYGTVSNSASQAIFTNKMIDTLFENTYNGFLNKEEIIKVKQGVELWFTAEEIRERWYLRVKYLDKKHKKESK